MNVTPGSIERDGHRWLITLCSCGRRFVLASPAELRAGTPLSCGSGCAGKHAEVVVLR